jgi:hypothetical protein
MENEIKVDTTEVIAENNEKKEGNDMKDKNELVISNLSDLQQVSKSKVNVFTSVNDEKVLFNIEANCNHKLNDCKGEIIRVKDVYIKVIETPLEEPIIDENTGEVVKEKEIKRITILVDDNGESYVTASKIFSYQFVKYLNMFGLDKITSTGLDIKIIETPVKNSSNKALGFELV